MTENQTPEQRARDNIDKMLNASGWMVQNKKNIDFSAGLGIAVREYQTDVGPADYVHLTGELTGGPRGGRKPPVFNQLGERSWIL